MSNVIHFNSPRERLKYIKGEFEEIIPIEAEKEVEKTEKEVEKTEEKPKKARKKAKKAKKED